MKDIPYIAFEAALARLERTIRRLWILAIILVGLLLATNAGWIWYESQFETVSIEAEQDATDFTRAIKKYGWNNFEHIIVSDGLSEEEAKAMEIKLIAEHKSNIRKYGFNISSGGESKSGTTISEYQKKRISEASKGKTVSPETREKLSKASYKTWSNPEYVEHMREINTGKKNPQYGKRQSDKERMMRGAKPILQYDLDGNFIAEHISCHFASEKTNISRDVISKCCKGIYKRGKGYVWKYKD